MIWGKTVDWKFFETIFQLSENQEKIDEVLSMFTMSNICNFCRGNFKQILL